MLRLLGYTDRLSAAPGDTIRFMVSSDHDRYASQLVRLIHGDTNPAGPGFKQVLVPSTIDGVAAGPHQDLPSGSSATLPIPAGELDCGLHVRGLRAAHGAGRARGGHREPRSIRSMATAGRCVVSEDGHARGGHRAQPGRRRAIATGIALPRWRWCFVALTVADGVAAVSHLPWRDPGADAGLATHRETSGGGPIAGRHGRAGPRGDGRRRPADAALRRSARPAAADRPGAVGRGGLLDLADAPDDLDDVAADLIGAWDFSLDIASDRVTDVSRPRPPRHARSTCRPARVTGHDFTTARRPTGAGGPASTARSTSIATTSRTPAGRSTSS